MTGVGPFVEEVRVEGGAGPLRGTTFAVKDLFDVAGCRTGAGNPAWLAAAPVATTNAAAVQGLLDAGATLVGRTHTDELAWSLSGTNAHYGTPTNPAAPDRAPGGSSSGSAVAVAAGLVDVALGTDTGGSIRVPASYCGIAGIRPTHGLVAMDGVLPLAPSFDTVGLLGRDATVLRAAFAALPAAPHSARPEVARLVVLADLVARCDVAVVDAVDAATTGLAAALDVPMERVAAGPIDDWVGAFRVLQSAEAWSVLGPWFEATDPPLGPGVAARFAFARTVTADDVAAAARVRAAATDRLAALLGDDAVLVVPAAPTAAHPLDLDGSARTEVRLRTIMCTSGAGLAGLPALALPLAADNAGCPVGLCLLGARGDDDLLLGLGERAMVR